MQITVAERITSLIDSKKRQAESLKRDLQTITTQIHELQSALNGNAVSGDSEVGTEKARQIYELLQKEQLGPRGIAERLSLNRVTVGYHLKNLKRTRMVKKQGSGRSVTYKALAVTA